MKLGRLLQPGQEAQTDFRGRAERVRITARRQGISPSQSGIQFQTDPPLHPRDESNPWAEWPPWIDADWFVPAPTQGELW